MKILKYIFALFMAILSGFAISSCDDDDNATFRSDSDEIVYSGVKVRTSFTVGVSAPDVSSDIEVETRSLDNAKIDYALPENGGRFKNIVIVLVDHNDRVYGMHCKEFENESGVKNYNYVFSNIEVPVEDVEQKRQYKVYAFGNVCKEHYENIVKNDTVKKFTTEHISRYSLNVNQYCINSKIELENTGNIYQNTSDVKDIPQYNISFEPEKQYKMNTGMVTSVGMPENRCVFATVVKGNTQFNVALKRVCARLKITFRNLTGQYIDASGNHVDNKIYIDKFLFKSNIFAHSTDYLRLDNSAINYSAESSFNILQALNCKMANVTESDHVHNKIDNDSTLTISLYVFEIQNADGWKYDLKIDRGKSLGNRAESLQDGNLYVLWSDNLDPYTGYIPILGVNDFHNTYNRCLGAEASNDNAGNHHFVYGEDLKYGEDVKGNVTEQLPFGSYSDDSKFGNRIFWKFYKTGDNKGNFENYKVNILNDFPEATGYYIPKTINKAEHLSSNLKNAGEFTIKTSTFMGMSRSYLKCGDYLMISNDKLQFRNIINFKDEKPYYPWVFFAKYIIKDNQVFGEGGRVSSNSSAKAITKIERNNNYELDFNVMPNYTDEEDLQVRCVRTQNEINWSEVEK